MSRTPRNHELAKKRTVYVSDFFWTQLVNTAKNKGMSVGAYLETIVTPSPYTPLTLGGSPNTGTATNITITTPNVYQYKQPMLPGMQVPIKSRKKVPPPQQYPTYGELNSGGFGGLKPPEWLNSTSLWEEVRGVTPTSLGETNVTSHLGGGEKSVDGGVPDSDREFD